jgi:hypothetical protein
VDHIRGKHLPEYFFSARQVEVTACAALCYFHHAGSDGAASALDIADHFTYEISSDHGVTAHGKQL